MAARPKRQRRGIGRTDQRSQMMAGTASLFDASALGNEEDAGTAGEEGRPGEPAQSPAQGPPSNAAGGGGGGGGGGEGGGEKKEVPVKQSKGLCIIL